MKRRPIEFDGWPLELAVQYGPYRGVVRHVVDGDTLDCLIDLGFNDYAYRTIRVAGVDAPEKNRAQSKEAGVAAQRFLEEMLPTECQVLLYTAPDPDSFGRYIALIKKAPDVWVHVAMVEAGHAVYREYR